MVKTAMVKLVTETETGNGNGNGAGNGQNTGETYLAADVRKMPDGGYGVYIFDKFVKGKRVMTPGGKHRKELKKVYKIRRMQMIT